MEQVGPKANKKNLWCCKREAMKIFLTGTFASTSHPVGNVARHAVVHQLFQHDLVPGSQALDSCKANPAVNIPVTSQASSSRYAEANICSVGAMLERIVKSMTASEGSHKNVTLRMHCQLSYGSLPKGFASCLLYQRLGNTTGEGGSESRW